MTNDRNKELKVVIVSEQPELFADLLTAAPEHHLATQLFNDLLLAREYFERNSPIDAVILGFPLDGIADFAAWVKIFSPTTAVIVAGGQLSQQQLVNYLDNGISGFYSYDTPLIDVVDTIRGITEKQKAIEGDHITGIDACAPAQNWVEMAMRSEGEYLARVQRFNEVLLRRHLSPELVGQICLALEEFGRNAMEWGNKFNRNKRVTLRYLILDTEIILVFEDEGEGFNWMEQMSYTPAKNLKDHVIARQKTGKRPGGFGLFMMRNIMDEVFYNAKGNLCVMKKYLTAKEPTSAEVAR